MPYGSYQQQNDYSLVKDIRPFDMPYASYMQEIATKQGYWKAGADRIKSVYDQAVGLDPQYAQGKQYLKDFISKATTNLEKISKSDLSIMDNSQQATTVFKPLFDTTNPFNKKLMMDSQLNGFYKKQQALSDLYRIRDGGKQWNQNNDIYFRDAQNKYLQDAQNGDYSTIDANYAGRKSFIPYYDYKGEITDIQSACKGYSQETQDVSSNPGYFVNSSSKGCSPEQLAYAYQVGLSDQAKQQMNIDGYVHYRGQEDVLAQHFTDRMITQPQEKITQLESRIAGLKAGKMTKDDEVTLQFLNSQLDTRKKAFDKNLVDFNNMTKGNTLEYVKNNYDRLAGNVYTQELTNSLGEAFRTDDVKKKLLPNAVEMQQRTINNQRYLQMVDNQHDVVMEGIKHANKIDEINTEKLWDAKIKALQTEGLNGPLKPFETDVTDPKSLPEVTKQIYIDTKLKPAQDLQEKAYNELVGYVTDKYGKDLPQGGLTKDNIDEFINAHNSKTPIGQDPEIARIYGIFKNATNEVTFALNRVDAIDKKIQKEHPELFDISKYDTKPLTNYSLKVYSGEPGKWDKISNPPPITQQDMVRILNGETVKGFSLGKVNDYVNYGGGTGGPSYGALTTKPGLYYNGKEVMQGDDKYIGDLFRDAQNAMGANLNKVNEYKTKEYTSKYYNENKFNIPNRGTLPENSVISNRLKTLMGATGKENEKNGFRILFYDGTGEGAYVVPLDKDGNPDMSGNHPVDNTLGSLKTGENHNAAKMQTPLGMAYYIPKVFPRPEGMGSDSDIKKTQDDIQKVQDFRQFIEGDLVKSNKGFVSSETMLSGTITLQTLRTGKDATVSIEYGSASGIKYKIQVKGDTLPLYATTPEEVSLLLNNR